MDKVIPTISVSVVSHGQIHLITDLLSDIATNCAALSLEVILTLNLPEALPFTLDTFAFPIYVISNEQPLGFGANHNQAFKLARGQFFCVINPDIRFTKNPFAVLTTYLKTSQLGVVAPVVLNEQGSIEDSARYFPTPFKILCKAFGKCKGSDYVIRDTTITPDWVGGMFMLFRHAVFQQLSGFNERYFLYYEDVDLCVRLRLRGYEVMLCPEAQVVHHAQRSSHRNLKYLRWHLQSMMRFFLSSAFWQWQYQKLK
jgi:GT2 family glycosyltransferase